MLFNDAIFKPEDWEGIQKLMQSNKKHDLLKVGQFWNWFQFCLPFDRFVFSLRHQQWYVVRKLISLEMLVLVFL